MFKTEKKIILCATNTRLTAGIWLGNKLQNYVVFNHDDQGHTEFGQYLAQYPNINIYLIVDAVEEDYKLESLPHTVGSARKEIVERKLSQFNRNSVYRAAHFINRATDKRKDDNFLFVALSNSDFMQSWMDAILANQAPLVGVYLLPMLSQVIVRQMKLMAPHILLCERLSSGLRQTYLHNGRLRISRLVPMSDVKPNQLAYFYLVEVDKTRLYLISQRYIGAETPLQLVFPALDNSEQVVAQSISQDQGLECKTVDILAFAKNNYIDSNLVQAQPELLHMQLLANGNVPDNLAPSGYTKAYNLNKIRRNIHIATSGIAIAGLAIAGYYIQQGYDKKEQLALVTAQTQQQQHLYEGVAQNFPATPIPSAELKIASDLAQIIAKNNQSPRQLMQILGAALETSPEITLSRMRWVQTENREFKDDDSRTTVTQTAPAVPVNGTMPADPTQLIQIGFMNGEIKGFSGDYRAALASVSRLASTLRSNPLVEQVIVLQEPVNVSSLANLQGSTTDESTAQTTPAIFKLKVILKPSAPAQPNLEVKP